MSHDPTGPLPFTVTPPHGPSLDADLWEHPGARLAVVCCHPHPLYGGSRRDHVVDALFRAAAAADATALRFDFRGVGRSQGRHDGGVGERDDVAAAIEAVVATGADRVVLAGYSFGADTSLAVDHPAVVAWFAAAPPLALTPPAEMRAGRDDRPVRLAVGEHDQFRSPDHARELTAAWPNVRVDAVPMADHFFAGGATRVGVLLGELLTEISDRPETT